MRSKLDTRYLHRYRHLTCFYNIIVVLYLLGQRRLMVALVVTVEDSGYLHCLGHVLRVSFVKELTLAKEVIIRTS